MISQLAELKAFSPATARLLPRHKATATKLASTSISVSAKVHFENKLRQANRCRHKLKALASDSSGMWTLCGSYVLMRQLICK